MKRLIYTKHLLYRLRVRGIKYELPALIIRTSDERYFDMATENLVAIKQVNYLGKIRDIVVIYREAETTIELITIHPLKGEQKNIRISSGRWVLF